MMEVEHIAVSQETTSVEPISNKDTSVRITPLGAGQEVGRSCILLSYRSLSVIKHHNSFIPEDGTSCSIAGSIQDMKDWPHCRSSITLIWRLSVWLLLHTSTWIIAQQYLISSGNPISKYLNSSTFSDPLQGRLFMTHPTKAIYRTLLSDFLKVSQNSENQLYSEVDLENSMEKIEVIDFNQTIDVDGIKVLHIKLVSNWFLGLCLSCWTCLRRCNVHC